MNETLISHLDSMLGVEPYVNNVPQALNAPEIITAVATTEEVEFKDDFAQARETLSRVLTKTEDAFDELVDIAKISENPRAFEVVSATAKTLADIADSLVKMHSAKQKVQTKEISAPSVGNINNAIFTTSEDLIKALKNGS
jgi:hypothetical protein